MNKTKNICLYTTFTHFVVIVDCNKQLIIAKFYVALQFEDMTFGKMSILNIQK